MPNASYRTAESPSGGKISIPLPTHPLTVGTHVLPLVDLPKGTRIVAADLVIETAAVNASGTTVAKIRTSEASPTTILGDTSINLEASAPAHYNLATAAGSGGPTSQATARKKMADARVLNYEVTIATAAATGAAVGVLILELVREDYAA